MTVLMFPPVVPDGVYRIRSADRSNPDQYLEWNSDNDVKPAQLKADSNTQKWKIEAHQDDLYTLTSVASNAALSIKAYDEGGQTKQRLFSGSQPQYWTLEPRGDDFIIGVAENANCVDLSSNNWVILWERNNLRNQRWILDSVEATSNPGGNGRLTGTGSSGTGTGTGTGAGTGTSTGSSGTSTVGPGVYNIKNRATDSEICIWTGYQYDNAPVLVWPATGTARTYSARAWNVSQAGEGVSITNAYWVAKGPRPLREGPFVSTSQNTCRLIPIAGTQYYHIATGTGANSRVLMDQNPPRTINQPATMSDYNKDDQRQHWEFTPAH